MISVLDRMVVKSFMPVFLVALLFFVLSLEMVELFGNLLQFLSRDATIEEILLVHWYYLPKCVAYAIAPALLFAVSYSMGNFFSQNQLVAVLGSGMSFFRFVLPLLILGLGLSVFTFYFRERVVIDTFARKNTLSQQLLGRSVSLSNTNITVLSMHNNDVYYADYYNHGALTLSGLSIIRRDGEGNFLARIEAEWAEYQEQREIWRLHNVAHYQIQENSSQENPRIEYRFDREMELPEFHADPAQFRRSSRDIEELPHQEARQWIESLRRSGRSGYREALTNYYRRFSFTLTPFIVVLISVSIGSRLKKNILLMSLLLSLILSVLYYVSDMILGLFAKQGIIEPAEGAWAGVILFFIAGVFLLRSART
ncbi:MAG TPA: YjgP/YjgQ family permease [Sediminispirochaeta sp.]|nr:YjgP/YjgQ family permease [Sediminispirochaeta sp.]